MFDNQSSPQKQMSYPSLSVLPVVCNIDLELYSSNSMVFLSMPAPNYRRHQMHLRLAPRVTHIKSTVFAKTCVGYSSEAFIFLGY